MYEGAVIFYKSKGDLDERQFLGNARGELLWN